MKIITREIINKLLLIHVLTITFGTYLFAAGPPSTDDFNTSTLNSNQWTFVNPMGDGSFSMTGTQLQLSVPVGSNHDPAWGGANNSVRTIQAVDNGDFTVTVKFDSIPNQEDEFEGILVEQDPANYLRFQFGSSSTDLHVTANQIVSQNETTILNNVIVPADGTHSLWLRLQRSGSNWTESWSQDGTAFNSVGTIIGSLTVSGIGPFAGNYHPTKNSAPGFAALVDSFVTGAAPAPPPPAGPGTDPVSDDFHNLTLNTDLWTYINPLGGSYSLTGTNLQINVQGGVTHDPVQSGVNYSSRVMQSMRNTDFSTEIKFDSIPTQTGTLLGVLVQQDASNFLRFEFQGVAGGTSLYAGKVIGNTPATFYNNPIAVSGASLWMRIARTGNDWSVSWSPDGVNYQSAPGFTQPLFISAIGPMVGNSGVTGRETPDFTASIDYFFNLASVIASQDGGSPRISNVRGIPGSASASITWNTDVNASSQVDFGLTPAYGSTISDPAAGTTHSLLLTGLTCAASYNYAVTSADAAGATRQSSNFIFTVPPCAQPSVPQSDNFDISSLNTAVWTWFDPNNDSYLTFNGTTAQITVPSNSSHDPLSPRGNGSAGIVQPIIDADFDVAARFVSDLKWGNTGQGIVVEQDALNYLLFELRSDGVTPRIRAASRAGATQDVLLDVPFHGDAPLWLRVARAGSTWIVSWSRDGNTYTPAGSFEKPMVTASLGLYAENAGPTALSTPAFTASIDSFVNMGAPLANKTAPLPFARIVIDPDPGTVLVQETMGDLDGDGRPDGVVGFTEPNQGLAWYRSPHSGVLTDKWDRFTITASGKSYEDVIVYDVNGDGAKDVIASIDSAIKWYENPAGRSGDPTTDVWQVHVISANAPGENNFILKDIDGDGYPDLVTPHSVYMGNGTDFGQAVNYNSSGFRGLALLDIGSGKGAINFVGTDPNVPFSFVWFENPRETGGDARSGQWVEHVIGASYPCDDAPSCFGGGSVANLATGDLNGDGRMDLVTVQSEGYPVIPPGGIIWWEAPADRRNGTWIKHTFDPGFDSPHNVWVADIDRNGTLDIIAAQQEQSRQRRISAFLNDGAGNFSMQILSNTGSHNPFLVDVNGDGWLDMFSAGHGRFGAPNPVELYINPGGGFTLP